MPGDGGAFVRIDLETIYTKQLELDAKLTTLVSSYESARNESRLNRERQAEVNRDTEHRLRSIEKRVWWAAGAGGSLAGLIMSAISTTPTT